MNSENSKTSESYRLLRNLPHKINLKRSDKYVVSSHLSMYYAWKNIKKSYKNNKYKISASTWNEKFELPDGPYYISGIQDYFECILKKHGEKTDNPSIRICVNQMEKRIRSKIKRGYYFQILTPETVKSLGSTKSKITKEENGETVVLLINCNFDNNDYQRDSRVSYAFAPNKSFGQL